jgi:hypothetical protein
MKLCIDCDSCSSRTEEHPKCEVCVLISPVNGSTTLMYCLNARADENACGMEAKKFKNKRRGYE